MAITEKQFVEEIVPGLPQGKHIRPDDARGWYQSVMDFDPERLEWHIARLQGLGGSDVGEIAAWKLGVYNAFKTPRDIIEEKLLRRPIEPQNKNMRRGTYLEPVIQRIFLEDYRAISRTDLIDAINKQTDPAHPWMRGNVDDVVEMGGLLFVVDYKSPTEAKEETSIQYAAQTHQYGHLLHLATNQRPHSHIVASFNYAAGETIPVEVPYSQEIMDAVLDGGDEIWNHVLNGTYPPYKARTKQTIPYTTEDTLQIEALEEEFIRYKMLADAATERHKELSALLGQKLSKDGTYLLHGEKMPLSVLSGSARQKLDEEKAEEVLMQTGAKISEFKAPGKKLDEDKVLTFLAEKLGREAVEEFYVQDFDMGKVLDYCAEKGIAPPVIESFSVSLRASKKGMDKEAVENAKESARRIVEDGAGMVDLGDDEVAPAVGQ